jgi:hypothetical protein
MKYLSFCIAIVLIQSCAKYETQYSGHYDTINALPPPTIIYELVFVQDGELKIATRGFEQTKVVPSLSNVQYASINAAHDKIAYKTSSGSIIIVDTIGNNPQIVPNSLGAVDFGWDANSDVFYYVNAGGTLSFFGGTIDVPTTNLHNYILGNNSIQSVQILPNNDIIAIVASTSGYRYLYWDKKTGGDVQMTLRNNTSYIRSRAFIPTSGTNLLNGALNYAASSNIYRYDNFTILASGLFNSTSTSNYGLMRNKQSDSFYWDWNNDKLTAYFDSGYNYFYINSSSNITDIDF